MEVVYVRERSYFETRSGLVRQRYIYHAADNYKTQQDHSWFFFFFMFELACYMF